MSVHRQDGPHAIAEPLPSVSLPRVRRDWTARARAHAHDTERYTRFVVRAKRGLLIASGLLLALVLAYALQPRQQNGKHIAMIFQRLGIVNNDLAMIKPRLSGSDEEGDPYVVTADVAIQDHTNARLARLKNIQGDVTLKGGKWISTTAPTGFLNATHPSDQTLALSGPIAVYSDDGYEIHTVAADVAMGSGLVTGNHPVAGQGPLGTFRADRFKVDREKKLVYLYGNVRMTIFGHGIKGI